MSKSKFSAVLNEANRRTADHEDAPDIGGPSDPAGETGASFPTSSLPPAPLSTPSPKRAGRPRGKRSDPDFEQVTAYLPSALYTRTRIALLEDGRTQEFSDLVAQLLSAWLDGRVSG